MFRPQCRRRPGDDVVVQLTDGQGLIKRLQRRTARYLILEQFNPEKRIEIPVGTVRGVHLVVAVLKVEDLTAQPVCMRSMLHLLHTTVLYLAVRSKTESSDPAPCEGDIRLAVARDLLPLAQALFDQAKKQADMIGRTERRFGSPAIMHLARLLDDLWMAADNFVSDVSNPG